MKVGQDGLQEGEIVVLDHLEESHRLLVALGRKDARRVVDVGDATAHAGGEVASGQTEQDAHAAGHVLAAVVAAALADGRRATIAHTEALGRLAAQVQRARDGAVEHHVADNDGVHGLERTARRRIDDDLAARQALADVVVGVAAQLERDAARQEGAEALAGAAAQPDVDRVVGEALLLVAQRDLVAQRGAECAVLVGDVELRVDARRATFENVARPLDHLHVQSFLELERLRHRAAADGGARSQTLRVDEYGVVVEAGLLEVRAGGARLELVGASDELAE